MFFKNDNYVIGYKVKSKTNDNYTISHKVDFSFNGNESVLFDNKKGARVYKGTSIEDARTWMGFAKNDFVAEVKIRDSEKVNFITLSMLENLDMKAIFPKRIEIYGKSNDRWLPINQLEIDLQDHPDDRKSYFKEFTLAVNLEGYNEVKIVAVNHFKFPKAPVYDRKRKYSWIFIDEVIFW